VKRGIRYRRGAGSGGMPEQIPLVGVVDMAEIEAPPAAAAKPKAKRASRSGGPSRRGRGRGGKPKEA
jgi:hypothetical protein